MIRLFIALALVATLLVVPTGDRAEEPGATSGIAAASVDTGVVVRRVWEGPYPEFWGNSVSPDGRYLSQTHWETGDAAVLDLLTGVGRPVTHFPFADSAGAAYQYAEMTRFSPDGLRLAYSWYGPPDWQYEVRVIDLDGSNERVLWRAVDELREEDGRVAWWPDVHGWAPDGSGLLVTFWASPSRAEMRLLPLDGSSARTVYRPPPWKGPDYAAISPDGRYLAFTENTEARSREIPEPTNDVFVLPLDGGGGKVSVAPSPGYDGLVGWTTDGRLLLASDRELTEGVWRVTLRDGRPVGEPELVKGDLWGIQPIGMAGDVVFYGIDTQVRQVHTVGISLDDRRLVGSLRPVESSMRRSEMPAWSHDGRRLAYRAITTSRGGNDQEFLVIRSTSGEAAQQVGSFARIRDVQWSATDRELHVMGEMPEHERKRNWLELDLATGEVSVVKTADEVAGCRGPSFHADDRRAVCVYMNQDTWHRQVVEYDLESGDRKVLWELPEGPTDPVRFARLSLSPDGTRIAFWEHDRRGPETLWTLHVLPSAGGESTELFSFERPRIEYASCSGTDLPVWTPDGTQLLISVPEVVREGEDPGPEPCHVHLVPVDGGSPVEIGVLPEHSHWALSPDGTRLAMVAGEPRGEIWVLEGAGR